MKDQQRNRSALRNRKIFIFFSLFIIQLFITKLFRDTYAFPFLLHFHRSWLDYSIRSQPLFLLFWQLFPFFSQIIRKFKIFSVIFFFKTKQKHKETHYEFICAISKVAAKMLVYPLEINSQHDFRLISD